MNSDRLPLHEEIMDQLWQNAIFDNRSFDLLEKISNRYLSIGSDAVYEYLPDLIHELTSIRNRKLITAEQQDKLRETVVGFFGLSVGSHAALTWVTQVRPKAVKIVDDDVIDLSNLNRLRFGIDSVGKMKVDVVRTAIEDISPYTSVTCLKSTDKDDALKLLREQPVVDVIVDAIDDFEGKIALRVYAKEKRIPVLSAADVGDNVVLDIERYDTEPDTQLFLGRMAGVLDKDFKKLSGLERKKMIISLVGFEQNSEPLLDSLLSIGKELASWPQLGATATMSGAIITTGIKKIVSGEKVLSGRYYISLDDTLVADFNSKEKVKTREKKIIRVKRQFNLD